MKSKLNDLCIIILQGMLSVDQSSESEDDDELHIDMEEDVQQ